MADETVTEQMKDLQVDEKKVRNKLMVILVSRVASAQLDCEVVSSVQVSIWHYVNNILKVWLFIDFA